MEETQHGFYQISTIPQSFDDQNFLINQENQTFSENYNYDYHYGHGHGHHKPPCEKVSVGDGSLLLGIFLIGYCLFKLKRAGHERF